VTTILLTGFGPFPGAPYNPTAPLGTRLARRRRPAWAEVTIVPHVFPTSYAAVDRDLPKLVAHHKPVALLMFGLATRARFLRIETQARNALARLPDVSGSAPRHGAIVAGGARHVALATPTRRLLAAARTARVPAALSRDAGRYLCNYLCWRAAEAAAQNGGPRVIAFIHVPPVRRGPASKNPSKKRRLTAADLERAGSVLLHATVIAARR
jgi:pyroglutamyl-peptidase